MPKYDAFGREIGEDTLAGLGGSDNARRASATPADGSSPPRPVESADGRRARRPPSPSADARRAAAPHAAVAPVTGASAAAAAAQAASSALIVSL